MKSKSGLPSYVYKELNKYVVKQKGKVYGRFKDKGQAISLRNKLVHNGTIVRLQGRHRIKNWEDRYIQYRNGKYYINKQVGKRFEYFGVYKTIEEARSERDYLESIAWDYSNME